MLPVDSLPGLSLILRVMHSSNLCNYKQARVGREKKVESSAFLKMNVPRSSRETFTSLSSRSWMGFNEASQVCAVCVNACVDGAHACLHVSLSSNEHN